MRNSSLNKLRLTQVDRAIEPYLPAKGKIPPPGGWLRSIREALGRTVRGQAALVGVAPATLQKSEQSEADDRITLGQLRKLANGLDCELVYALIPKKPLHDMVEERAEWLARKEIMGVSHMMALEDQRPSDSFVERKVSERRQELLAGAWSRLWR
ncbi:mobile mystery protein A [Pseudomonas nunensis]|uniref:mobile mystery protein A n=1 Tax=Pseudomonas nunensis TaxID=2961896 RepID=UPI0025AF553B|nr:mobile mystery protein A [Pseudomonas nunensis]MDN3220250.1 mobile mystery protein A [Pseudomonas nunensis]